MSRRGDDWKDFSDVAYNHLENYTVPQYGDKGEDQITKYSIEDCVTQVAKYCNRYGKNSREGQQLLDFIKMAHYAQCAYHKYKEKGPSNNTKLVFNGHWEGASDFKEISDAILTTEGKKIRITVEE